MAGVPEIQVSRLLDERGLSSFQIKLIVWTVLIALIDGYDIGAIAFAAPHLVREWGIPRTRSARCSAPATDRHPVRLGALRLDRRPIRPQDRADLRQPAVRRVHLRRRLLDQSRPNVLAAAARRSRHRRRHSQYRRDQRRIGAAPTNARRWRSSLSASCRWAAHSPALSARRWCRTTAGRSCS